MQFYSKNVHLLSLVQNEPEKGKSGWSKKKNGSPPAQAPARYGGEAGAGHIRAREWRNDLVALCILCGHAKR